MTLFWLQTVLGSMAFGKRLPTWDSYRCHTCDAMKKDRHGKNIDCAVIPNGYTSFIQAPHVRWNKPLKGSMRAIWLAGYGQVRSLTPLQATSRQSARPSCAISLWLPRHGSLCLLISSSCSCAVVRYLTLPLQMFPASSITALPSRDGSGSERSMRSLPQSLHG